MRFKLLNNSKATDKKKQDINIYIKHPGLFYSWEITFKIQSKNIKDYKCNNQFINKIIFLIESNITK